MAEADLKMIEAELVLEVYDINTGESLGWIHRWNNGEITASIDTVKSKVSFRTANRNASGLCMAKAAE